MITITGTSLELDVKIIDHHKAIAEVYDKANKILFRGYAQSITSDSRYGGWHWAESKPIYDIEVEFVKVTEVKT